MTKLIKTAPGKQERTLRTDAILKRKGQFYGTARIVESDAKPIQKIEKQHKYRANATTVDGIRFASEKEANRYGELKLLEKAGKISKLELQVPYKLVVEETYLADFRYLENGSEVVEDVKGCLTREYKRKRKAMKKQHGVTILET